MLWDMIRLAVCPRTRSNGRSDHTRRKPNNPKKASRRYETGLITIDQRETSYGVGFDVSSRRRELPRVEDHTGVLAIGPEIPNAATCLDEAVVIPAHQYFPAAYGWMLHARHCANSIR